MNQHLPASWVDRIFANLHGIYGTSFTSKYATGVDSRGIDSGLENAKATWAEDLAGFYDMPEAIAYGLRNVDAKFPPSSREFAALCRMAPKPTLPALPMPEVSEEQRQQNLNKLQGAMAKAPAYDFKHWAKKLKHEFLSGLNLTHVQVKSAAEALGEVWEVDSETRQRVCRPIATQ